MDLFLIFSDRTRPNLSIICSDLANSSPATFLRPECCRELVHLSAVSRINRQQNGVLISFTFSIIWNKNDIKSGNGLCWLAMSCLFIHWFLWRYSKHTVRIFQSIYSNAITWIPSNHPICLVKNYCQKWNVKLQNINKNKHKESVLQELLAL